MRVLWVVLIAACGRIGFDATGSGTTGSGGDAPGTGVDSALASPPSSARAFTAGFGHICGGNGNVSCWGFNQEGQVGEPIGGNYLTPQLLALGGIQAVAVGELGSCAISSGAVYCWGSNYNGEQGQSMSAGSTQVPVEVTGGGAWKEISLRRYSACGVRTDGSLWCWGNNTIGQNGEGDNGSASDRWVPTRVGTRTDWSSVAMTGDSGCALTSGGAAYCWGGNAHGAVGVGDLAEHDSPLPVSGTQQFAKIIGGKQHICALDIAGGLWCWGDNNLLQLGFADRMDRDVPTKVDEHVYVDLAPGWYHTCAIRSDHTLWCWGDNNQGAYGAPSPETATPVQIGTGISWRSVSAGCDFECMTDEAGQLWCMGNNPYGQLGQGNMSPATTPVKVSLP